MSNLPALIEPLTPAECDLAGLEYLPLQIARLLASDTFLLSTGDEFKAALTLWAKSWHRVPAASIPADPRIQASLVGISLREWSELKEVALRGWMMCGDGLLYHPVVAEAALVAWLARLTNQRRSGAGNRARHGAAFDPEAFEAAQETAAECLVRVRSLLAPTRKLRGGGATSSSAPSRKPEGSPKDSGVGVGVEEERKKEAAPNGAAKKEARPKVSPSLAKRIPPAWFASEADRAYAAGKGLTPPEIDGQEDAFRDFWLARGGEKGRKLDWAATWRTWIRRNLEDRDERKSRAGGGRREQSAEGVGGILGAIVEARRARR